MPGLLWLFFVAVGLGTGSTLVADKQAGPIWAGTDHESRNHLGKPTPDRFIIQSNYPWRAVALTQDWSGHWVCPTTITVTSSRKMRLSYNGVEQIVDTGWTFDLNIPEGKMYTGTAIFVDPVTRETVALKQVIVSCIPSGITPVRNQILYDERGLRGYEAPCTCCTKDDAQ